VLRTYAGVANFALSLVQEASDPKTIAATPSFSIVFDITTFFALLAFIDPVESMARNFALVDGSATRRMKVLSAGKT
jgi:hypothetical protein